MFGTLTGKLNEAFRKLSGSFKLTEANVSAVTKEIRRALLDADVDYGVVKKLVEETKQKALGREVTKGVSPAQMFVNIMYGELVAIMGTKSESLRLDTTIPPVVVMVAGLQGTGKTTFTAKLAAYLKKKGHAPLLVACDIYRPAAVEQLRILGDQIQVPVYSGDLQDVLAIARDGLAFAKQEVRDVVIVDTAGRLQIDEEMMKEAEALKKTLAPSEILFVVDGTIGQEAVRTAKAFNDRLNFSGVVVTKMDGDTRGGVALSVRAVLNKPIKFISQSEKVEDLDIFYPERVAQRILGMGDVVSFVEKIEDKLDKEKVQALGSKFLSQSFTMEDFLQQIQEVKKLGSVKSIMDMMPGFSGMAGKIDDNEFTRVEAIIYSMTKEERAKPYIIDGSRRTRIAKGSGQPIPEVNKLLKQFETAKKIMMAVGRKKGAMAQASLLKNMLNQKNRKIG